MSKELEEFFLKQQDVVLKKFDTLEKGLKDTKDELKGLYLKMDQRMDNLESEVKNLELEVKDTQEVVNYLNQNFTKFDYEINKKIDTLFDSHAVTKENDKVHEDNIVSLNAKVFDHDIRISNLENKVLTA